MNLPTCNATNPECSVRVGIRQKNRAQLLKDLIEYGKDQNHFNQYVYVVNEDPDYYADITLEYDFLDTTLTTKSISVPPTSSYFGSFLRVGSNPKAIISYRGMGAPFEYRFRLYSDKMTCILVKYEIAGQVECETLDI